MNKLIIILVVVVATVAVFLFLGGNIMPQLNPTSPTSTPTPSPVTTSEPAAPISIPQPSPTPTPPAAQESTIEINDGGFSPSTITIKKGTTVRFINRGTSLHWPASGVHPIHQVCPGLDALKPIKSGESYSFTFTVAKTCPVHDHLNPSLTGSIIVQ